MYQFNTLLLLKVNLNFHYLKELAFLDLFAIKDFKD
jgi:hypothetical protein